MPGFDGTGPRGMGSMTGRGMGFCAIGLPGMRPYGPWANYPVTGQWPTPQAQAYWQAMQAGQAPYPFYGGAPAGATPSTPQMSPEQELDFLKNQAQNIKGQLLKDIGRVITVVNL